MWNEFKGAYRMRHPFEIVALTMGKVIHGVNVPCSSCAMVGVFYYTVHYRVAEMHI